MVEDRYIPEFYVEEAEYGTGKPLDLFSTSPTKGGLVLSTSDIRCAYHAPFFAYKQGNVKYRVVQGCCNHWDCPRCGKMVAAKHYGRIVEGARQIAKTHQLFFITLTCRGKEVSVEEAEASYLKWTSKFLDNAYAHAKRNGQAWYYVQVTEKQKRGHPHSHILTSFKPIDLEEGTKENWRRGNDGILLREDISCLRSNWLLTACIYAGLGNQYDISEVRSVEAASRYVAKYMFKDSQFAARFPKRWKRVRYSNSWPDMPKRETDAFVLLTRNDWRKLAHLATIVTCDQGEAFEQAEENLTGSDVIVMQRKNAEHNDSSRKVTRR